MSHLQEPIQLHPATNRPLLRSQLIALYNELIQKVNESDIQVSGKNAWKSHQNLLAFLNLQKLRTEQLEQELVREGLSSLTTIYPHVLYSLRKMVENLSSRQIPVDAASVLDQVEAAQFKTGRNIGLFGGNGENPGIMVTLDKAMLENPESISALLDAGMKIARINCAHDDPTIWKALVKNVRVAQQNAGKTGGANPEGSCKIYMDLAGPKIRIGPFRSDQKLLKLIKGDRLRIYRDSSFLGFDKTEAEPASISITAPKALRNVAIGDKIFLDDGKIFARVFRIEPDYIEGTIIQTQSGVVKLKEGKGVNLPDSLVYLNVPSLTKKDIEVLPVVCELADIIGLSFVHHPNDLIKLREQMKAITAKKVGVVAKIETKASVFHLSKIIVEGLNFGAFGIMIARGDLAVEIGYQELSQVQESILEICKASHIPVIWATGVLDRLARKGIPTRTELTDAYMGLRADCIMLNKGPFIVEAVKMLQTINQASSSSEFINRNGESIIQYGF